MQSIKNLGIPNFQVVSCFKIYEKDMIKYQLLYLSLFINNQYKNSIDGVFGLTKLDKSLGSLYLLINQGYYSL